MKHILILVGLLSASVIAQGQNAPARLKKPKQTKADADLWLWTAEQGPTVLYRQHKELLADVEKEAKLKLWSPDARSEAVAKLPAGGALVIRPFGGLQEADPARQTIVLRAPDGTELLRHVPKSSTPEYFGANPISREPYYMGLAVVPLEVPIQTGALLFVIDEAKQKRYEYEVRPL